MRQFVSWIENVEESLNSTDKQVSEMRDKAANLGKAKVYVIACIMDQSS